MIKVREYTFQVYTARELADDELRALEQAIDDTVECDSWTTTASDTPRLFPSASVGVDFGEEVSE